jgi:hypothetical protein
MPVALLQWAANRYAGRLVLICLTLGLVGFPLWIAHWVIPRAIQAAISARTCFNCDLAYYALPVLWGLSAFFAVSGVVIARWQGHSKNPPRDGFDGFAAILAVVFSGLANGLAGAADDAESGVADAR